MSICDLVRNTCLEGSLVAKHVRIDDEAVAAFAKRLESVKIDRGETGLPLKFDNINEEINFHVLYAILQFGSGYRHKLHKITGRGAASVIQYGLISMVLNDKTLDAYELCNIGPFDIERDFKIPYQVEGQHPTNPIIRIQVDSEVKSLVEKIKHVCNECGKILRARSCKDFGQFVLDHLKKNDSAVSLVQELVDTFPAFQDVGFVGDVKVHLYKKAQLAVAELYALKDQDPKFDFKDIGSLTIFADNVIPAVLIKEGVLIPSEDLSKKITNKMDLKPGQEEIELRVCAVVACEKIVSISKKFTATNLDYYLWGVLGKEKEYRDFERHYTPDTIFY